MQRLYAEKPRFDPEDTLTDLKRRFRHILLLLPLLMLAAACSPSKYLGEEEKLLYRTSLHVEMEDGEKASPEVEAALKKAKNYYFQKENTKPLGIGWLPPISMHIYCLSSPKSEGIFSNYFRRIGQKPVVYSTEKSRQTSLQLQRLLDSKGCFHSTVDFDTVSLGKRRVGVRYNIKATRRYIIDEVVLRTENEGVRKILHEASGETLLVPGTPYDQDNIVAERARIVSTLREAGYFSATAERVSFLIDTTYSDSRLGIDINVDGEGLEVYHIGNVFIHPNNSAAKRETTEKKDTLHYTLSAGNRKTEYQFVYDRPMSIRPETIGRSMMIAPGMTYRPRHINDTYNSLLGLRNFHYINIELMPREGTAEGEPTVDAHVRLVESTKQRFSLSFELTNASPLGAQDSGNFFTNGNLGLQTSIEYQHKNIFHGAELLKAKGSVLFELPKLVLRNETSSFYDNFSAFEAGLDLSLDMPVFLLPFASRIVFQRVKPHTLFSASGSYQYRYYFERIIANTSFGYTWNHTQRSAHQLLPIEMTFVRMLNIDEEFSTRLRQISDIRLTYQYSSHFILNSRYDYTFSSQRYGSWTDFSFLHLSAETAGNLLALVAAADRGADGLERDINGVREILGVPFSQYARIGAELTRYNYVGSRSTLVGHLLLGIGLPYGNSVSMPYEKSFFGGGPTTMRAWQLRHLGPGAYTASGGEEELTAIERVGDLQMVLNLEGRFPIFKILEGAAFADIGNVWLMNSSSQYEGGEIKWNSLPEELAVGIGLGLRMSVSIATLRVDFAIPLYDPGFESERRWRPHYWKANQIVANFGINYPF